MHQQPEKLDLKSLDITQEKKQKFKQLFPEVFREDEIDFEHLKRLLSKEWNLNNAGKERFGLQWPGKADCMKIIQQPSIATLKPDREESVDFDETENLFIGGDNLEVLKLLQKSYFGKVKMIYIDPPYNTGNEFIYPDNYSESLDTYLKYTGQKDQEGNWQTTNRDTDGRFHSRWLNMMYPRLFLAKNLLRDDGVIFISIDDHEIAHLRKLCDEIFGEEKFIAQFNWKSRQNKDNRNKTGASIDHEYIIAYGNKIRGDDRNIDQYSNPDNDQRGLWTSANMVGLLPEDQRPNCHYDLINPKTKINYGRPEMGWRYDKNTMNKLIEKNKVLWPDKLKGRPRRKKFLSEIQEKYTGFSSMVGEDIYTRDGTAELKDFFGVRTVNFPKPSKLILDLVKQGLNDTKDGIVLDFFSGSCSTAHAVLERNQKDDGNRKFIMVQLPEPTDEDSEANKAGFDTIADIGKERIRRVIKKLKDEEEEEKQQTELELEEETEDQKELDLGFKVFKLDKSNFKVWDALGVDTEAEKLEDQLDVFADHITPEAERESILYELILKSGYPLSTEITQKEIDGHTLFSIDDEALLIYLDEGLTFEILEKMAEMEPNRIVCLDKSFTGEEADALKTNAVQLFKANDITFRTV
jgi:adenine-specific DNA-methyltransferase